MELIKMWLQKKSSEKPKQNEETNILAEVLYLKYASLNE